jgi:riboflavin kinase, archaea type
MVTQEVSPALLLTLFKLAELGAYSGELSITTADLAKRLNVSQQTASRHLIELQTLGLVRRTRSTRGETIKVTAKGSEELNRMHLRLKAIFELKPREVMLEGILFSGIGEGAWYVSQPGYHRQFAERLGFNPFPGTLNLRLKPEYEDEKRLLETIPHIQIEGFRDGERTFGPVVCHKTKINDSEDGALISAVRTHYAGDVIEVVAASNLREKLGLRDGDTVRVRVIGSTLGRTSA